MRLRAGSEIAEIDETAIGWGGHEVGVKRQLGLFDDPHDHPLHRVFGPDLD